METVFKSIDIEKRDKIINSALEEFGEYGFEKASINSIVKNASISKGFLYHHLNGKEELYNYLEDFSFRITLDAIKNNIDWKEEDIFIRIKQIAQIKFKLLHRYPYIYKFFTQSLKNKTPKDIEKLLKKQPLELSKKVYEYNIDFSKFKDQENIKEQVDIIRWSIEKFGEEYVDKVKNSKDSFDYNIVWKEFYNYMSVLKKALYK
ncbi:TetR/AcrR family transcriptional regulator [Clostridium oceanicum]|uniref:TetR/AcrR family transcriptional regulator n=1 Tax=Clostridium oceanicum TaxID=1543 RepID=A0ABN1JCY5_9CLOT